MSEEAEKIDLIEHLTFVGKMAAENGFLKGALHGIMMRNDIPEDLKVAINNILKKLNNESN